VDEIEGMKCKCFKAQSHTSCKKIINNGGIFMLTSFIFKNFDPSSDLVIQSNTALDRILDQAPSRQSLDEHSPRIIP
jgi:hypothetical protein